jgi:hypothetical protein
LLPVNAFVFQGSRFYLLKPAWPLVFQPVFPFNRVMGKPCVTGAAQRHSVLQACAYRFVISRNEVRAFRVIIRLATLAGVAVAPFNYLTKRGVSLMHKTGFGFAHVCTFLYRWPCFLM